MNIGVFVQTNKDLAKIKHILNQYSNDDIILFLNPYFDENGLFKEVDLSSKDLTNVSLIIYLPLSFYFLDYEKKQEEMKKIIKDFKLDLIYLNKTLPLSYIKKYYYPGYHPSTSFLSSYKNYNLIMSNFYLNKDSNFLIYYLANYVKIRYFTNLDSCFISHNQLLIYKNLLLNSKYSKSNLVSIDSYNYLRNNLLDVNEEEFFKVLKTKSINSSRALKYLFLKTIDCKEVYTSNKNYLIIGFNTKGTELLKSLKINKFYNYRRINDNNFKLECKAIDYYKINCSKNVQLGNIPIFLKK